MKTLIALAAFASALSAHAYLKVEGKTALDHGFEVRMNGQNQVTLSYCTRGECRETVVVGSEEELVDYVRSASFEANEETVARTAKKIEELEARHKKVETLLASIPANDSRVPALLEERKTLPGRIARLKGMAQYEIQQLALMNILIPLVLNAVRGEKVELISDEFYARTYSNSVYYLYTSPLRDKFIPWTNDNPGSKPDTEEWTKFLNSIEIQRLGFQFARRAITRVLLKAVTRENIRHGVDFAAGRKIAVLSADFAALGRARSHQIISVLDIDGILTAPNGRLYSNRYFAQAITGLRCESFGKGARLATIAELEEMRDELIKKHPFLAKRVFATNDSKHAPCGAEYPGIYGMTSGKSYHPGYSYLFSCSGEWNGGGWSDVTPVMPPNLAALCVFNN